MGNDYLVLESGRLSFRLDRRAVRLLCDRHLGIGSDGILLRVSSRHADAGVRILNPDGSEAQKSGNGVRIFALYLHRYGLPGRRAYSIETKGGLVRAAFKGGNTIEVDMGKAIFDSRVLPIRGKRRQAVRERIRVGGKTLLFTGLSVGNPHAVFFFRRGPDPDLLRRLGPLIESHRMFPERTNVQFARIVSSAVVRAIIWERGAGETLASGSSSCAVVMPGGTLLIRIADDWSIRMTGPAEEVATGIISGNLLRRLRS